MKSGLLVLVLALSTFALADEAVKTSEKKEIPTKEDQGKIMEAAKSVSSGTKKLLRKVGRKSMDETCELSASKEECDKQKAEHKALTEKEAVEGIPAN